MYGRRHNFISRILFLVAASVLLLSRVHAQSKPARPQLRIGFIVPSRADDVSRTQSTLRGVRLGVSESRQTAALFGGTVDLFEVTARPDKFLAAAAALVSAQRIQVLLTSSERDTDALSKFAEARHVVFVNLSSRSRQLRAACRRYTFHVEASDDMYANARRLDPASSPAASARVLLWEPSLERYGAGQLNARYRSMFKAPMDGYAWAGWAAVKIVAEAVLRARAADAAALAGYLESNAARFDGHKGWPLTFRRADHQLRQPLYIVVAGTGATDADRRVRDVPALRARAPLADGASDATPEAQLDQLSSGNTCTSARRR